MKVHRLQRRFEAIRMAVAETVSRITHTTPSASLRISLGLGLTVGEVNKKGKFASHDEIWS